MKRVRISLMVCAVLLAGVGMAHGWPWSTDMFNQKSIKPQERPMMPPANSVPAERWEMPIPRIEAGQKLSNPIPPTDESIARGRELFRIHCLPCHGPEGAGDGTIAKVYMMPPPLAGQFVQQRPDGYLHGTVRFGGPVMPPYGDAVEGDDKWHIVNFLRSLAK